jgi:hypothetical protein
MAVIRFGVVVSFDAGTRTACVSVQGYAASVLEGVAVADNIADGLVVAAANCVVVLQDGYNARDAVVVAIW